MGKRSERASRFTRPALFAFTGLAFLILIYPLLWLRVLLDPLQRTAVDFLPFYAAGSIARSEGMPLVYDWETQRHAEDQVLTATLLDELARRGLPTPGDPGPALSSSEVNPFPHPPFLLPLLAWLARLEYLPAYIVWVLLMAACALLAALLLARLVPQAVGRSRLVLLLGIWLFFPLYFSLLNGQDSALLLLAAAVWAWGLDAGRERLSGLGLALVSLRPHMALVLGPLFLFKHRKVGLWFLAGTGLLVGISLLLLGPSGVGHYLDILLASASGEGNKFFNEELMVNLLGLLRRTLPQLPGALLRRTAWWGYFLAIAFLCVVWIRSRRIQDRHIGLAVVLTLLAAPHCHYHDLALLLLPLVGCIRRLLERERVPVEQAVLLPLGASLVLFFGFFIVPGLKYPSIYLLMVLLVGLLWLPEKLILAWERQKLERK